MLRVWSQFLFMFLGFALPNLVFGLCAYGLGVGRPLINIDYALCVLLLAFAWRWWGGGLLIFVLLMDALSLAGQIVPFMRLGDIFYLLQFTLQASVTHVLLLLVSTLLIALVGVAVFAGGRRTERMAALLVFNVLVLAHFIYDVDIDPDKQRFYKSTGYSLVESQTVLLMRSRGAIFLSMFDSEGQALSPLPGKSASESFWQEAKSGGGSGRLLLVVAESWGLPRDERIQEAILAPLQQLKLERMQYGQIAPRGTTVAGELRELCHLYPEHYNLAQVAQGFESCLPNILRDKGFTTVSLHGATRLMYDRHHWYPRAGFDQSVFFEDRIWPRRCYSFPGACDLDIFTEVKRYFNGEGRRFLYWLTLNTHGPYDLRDLEHDVFDCKAYGLRAQSESCRNFKLQAQFFSGLAKLLQMESMKGVEFVVVGDHPPMLLDAGEKDKVFQGDVPFISGSVGY